MKATIPQPLFLKTLQIVERAVNDRTTLPILANVLVDVTGDELTLTATDLDVGVQCRFPLTPPVERGAVALPARKLTTIIRELPDEPVTVEAKKNHAATIQCGSSSFRIPGLPAEDFPLLPTTSGEGEIRLPQETLKTLVTQTAYAMSTEETRFILNGALFTAQKDTLSMVATDGRRLALASSHLLEPVKRPLQVVVPAKTIRELSRLLQEDSPEDVALIPLQDNQLTIRFGPVTIVTRLIEGQFPQYEKVIPPPSKHILSCRRQPLIDAIRRASLMTTATSQAIVFELSQTTAVISKESPELGSAREEIEASYTGEPTTVAFNPEFWLDVLGILHAEEVHIEISGPDKPAAIRQDSFTYIVLPMKLA